MPTTTLNNDARMAQMTFAEVYPHYVAKVERKGRRTEKISRQ
jgi:hypothetical protein